LAPATPIGPRVAPSAWSDTSHTHRPRPQPTSRADPRPATPWAAATLMVHEAASATAATGGFCGSAPGDRDASSHACDAASTHQPHPGHGFHARPPTSRMASIEAATMGATGLWMSGILLHFAAPCRRLYPAQHPAGPRQSPGLEDSRQGNIAWCWWRCLWQLAGGADDQPHRPVAAVDLVAHGLHPGDAPTGAHHGLQVGVGDARRARDKHQVAGRRQPQPGCGRRRGARLPERCQDGVAVGHGIRSVGRSGSVSLIGIYGRRHVVGELATLNAQAAVRQGAGADGPQLRGF